MSIRQIWLSLTLCLSSSAVFAAPLESEDEWMALLLNGKKIGYLQHERHVHADRIVNRESFHLSLLRASTALEVSTSEESIETLDGRPLSFLSRQKISGNEMVVRGTVDEDGTVEVTTEGIGSQQRQSFAWDPDAVMAEGLRRALQRHGLKAGVVFETKIFVPSSLQTHDLHVTVGELQTIDVFGTDMRLVQVEQRMTIGQAETSSMSWMDNEYATKKMRVEVMGMVLEGYACPQTCATSASEPAEFFSTAFAPAPQPINDVQRTAAITYHIIAKNAELPLGFPTSDEQSVRQMNDGSYRLTVTRVKDEPRQSTYSQADYLGQTQWLQSDEPEIQKLARQARGNAQTANETMLRLRDFVRDYVSDKNLSVGYASALEVARNRSGDCTEHALLLAAMGRAVGIPTRVATGIAYVDRWLGAEDVFVPHAWTQALIDGRWVSFDAALGRFGTGHIALSYGDGDPWRFYDGVNALGNIDITALEVVP